MLSIPHYRSKSRQPQSQLLSASQSQPQLAHNPPSSSPSPSPSPSLQAHIRILNQIAHKKTQIEAHRTQITKISQALQDSQALEYKICTRFRYKQFKVEQAQKGNCIHFEDEEEDRREEEQLENVRELIDRLPEEIEEVQKAIWKVEDEIGVLMGQLVRIYKVSNIRA